MLERILPASAAVATTCEDLETALYPEEEVIVSRAVEKRRREFTTARACARDALGRLGQPQRAIPVGSRGEPLWPAGVVGSITHCDAYRACAVARDADLISLGIDAERNEPLPEGLLGDIALPEECRMLWALAREDPTICWDRLLFSAKETVYKAWYPLARRWLGFEDAILSLDRAAKTYSARLLVPGPVVEGRELTGFEGRWMADGDLLLTAIALVPGARGGAA
jgi:4'-phosphopantetheinyl transferase EntD